MFFQILIYSKIEENLRLQSLWTEIRLIEKWGLFSNLLHCIVFCRVWYLPFVDSLLHRFISFHHLLVCPLHSLSTWGNSWITTLETCREKGTVYLIDLAAESLMRFYQESCYRRKNPSGGVGLVLYTVQIYPVDSGTPAALTETHLLASWLPREITRECGSVMFVL